MSTLLKDADITRMLNALPFETMVTGDDIFFLLARAVEHELSLKLLGGRSLAAVKTLEAMGYTWVGAELWKPPVGGRGDQP